MNFWSSNYPKATNMPAIQGHLPRGSPGDLLETSLALASPPPHARGDRRPPEATLGCSACHFPTKSHGPPGRSLTAPSAGSRAKAPALLPRRPSGLGVLGHHPPPGQLRPAALTHFSDRLQATRRPTVARRPTTRTRLPAPGSHPASHARPPQPAGILPHASPPCGSALHPAPPCSPLGAGNSCRHLLHFC